MGNDLHDLLNHDFLNDDVKANLTEAFSQKLLEAKAQAKKEAELELSEQFSRRFSEAKKELVSATDRMVTEAVEKYVKEQEEIKQQLSTERAKFTEAVKEQRAIYSKKLSEHSDMLEQFVTSVLRKEISELHEDTKQIRKNKQKSARIVAYQEKQCATKLKEHLENIDRFVVEKLKAEIDEFKTDRIRAYSIVESVDALVKKQLGEINEHVISSLKNERTRMRNERAKLVKARAESINEMHKRSSTLAEQYDARLAKIEKFVLDRVSAELKEFEIDKKGLQDERIALREAAAEKLAQTQKKFITRAAAMVEQAVNTQVAKELTELHESIQEASKNDLGREMFEAFSGVFSTKFFNESEAVKKINAALHESEKKRKELIKLTETQNRLLETVSSQAAVANDVAERTKILNDLLSPLDKSKRQVMEQYLSSIKTNDLHEAYARYIPLVLDITLNTTRASTKIMENAQPTTKALSIHNGNRISQKVDDNSTDIANIRRLAGLL